MHSEFVEELLTSLKGLYKSALYSDLVVQCGETKHNVHQAVVYPRAQKLKKEVEDASEQTSKKDKNVDYLDLSEDDPQAVELLLHYLYHLDYPHIPTEPSVSSSAAASIIESKANGLNGISGHSDTASTNGASDETVVNGGGAKLAPEYSIEKEAFIQRDSATAVADEAEPEATTSKKAMKKKKKRAMSVAPVNGVEITTNGTTNHDPHINGNGTATAAPAATSPQSPKTNGTHAVQPPPTTTITDKFSPTTTPSSKTKSPPAPSSQPLVSSNSPNLTIHARLYSLATKYSVAGLRSLSSQKFADELKTFWRHDDFLTAAQEAYTSTDRSDRVLRDAVLSAIKLHQDELLRRKEVQDVIRGLELSFDLLMVMHGGNGEGDAGGKVGMVNGTGAHTGV